MVVVQMSIGLKITELRKKKNLTQDELAKKIGISRAALSHYEKDRREPDYDTLKKMADFFEVTTDYLLDRETENDKIDYYKNKIATEFPDIDLMFKDMESLTVKEMQEVYEYIKFKKNQKRDDIEGG